MPVDDIDQGAAKDQPHNAMTGSQDNDISGVDFHTDYIRKKHALFTSRRETLALDCSRGVVLTKKNWRIPGSLSLSLSLSPPLEERAGGEVRGSWTLVGSNHPTAIFGQRIPYPAAYGSLFLVRGRYRLKSIYFRFYYGRT